MLHRLCRRQAASGVGVAGHAAKDFGPETGAGEYPLGSEQETATAWPEQPQYSTRDWQTGPTPSIVL